MKNKIFNGKLYLEGLRQTKIAGIILGIITIFLTVLSPISYIFDYYANSGQERDVVQIDFMEFTPLLEVFMFVLPIVFTIILFSFLNKRKGSDFYHSLPCTRNCLFLSFSVAILTWIAGIILTTVLLTWALFSVAPGVIVSWIFVPYSFFTFFSGALLVMAIMLLAKSLTGTTFNSLVVAGIICYFPRLLTHMFDEMLTEMAPVLQSGTLGIFSNLAYNIPVYYSIGDFFMLYEEYGLSFIGGIIYTMVLAGIYFGFALWIFQKRKSETAQSATLSNWLQHIFRCLITLPVTFIYLGLWSSYSDDFFSFFVIFHLALIVYLGYELITTKKVKNLLKALPVFPAVIAFDVLFVVSLLLTQNVLLADTPNAAQIQSVNVSLNGDAISSFYDNHYNDLLIREYYIEDETLEEMVSQGLSEAVKAVKDGTYDDKAYISGQYYEVPVSIRKENGVVIKRNVIFTKEQLQQVEDRYEQEESYQRLQVQLPTLAELNYVYIDGSIIGNKAEFWGIFTQEYEALSQEEQRAVIENAMSMDMSRYLYISVYGYKDTTSYYADYAISADNLPNTYTWCLQYLNNQAKEVIDTFWQEVDNGKDGYYGYEITLGPVEQEWEDYYVCYVGNPDAQYWDYDEIDEFSELPVAFRTLQAATARKVTATESVYFLMVDKQIDYNVMYSGEEDYATIYFNLTEEEYEVLKEYLPK